MRKQSEVVWVSVGVLVGVLIGLLASSPASAQTPTPRPDLPLLATGGIYPMWCMSPPDVDMAQICFVRTDLADPVELGCVSAGPSEEVMLDLNIASTTDVDAEIRCYAVDTDGLVGDYSLNAGTVDFTRPGRPYVVSGP